VDNSRGRPKGDSVGRLDPEGGSRAGFEKDCFKEARCGEASRQKNKGWEEPMDSKTRCRREGGAQTGKDRAEKKPSATEAAKKKRLRA